MVSFVGSLFTQHRAWFPSTIVETVSRWPLLRHWAKNQCSLLLTVKSPAQPIFVQKYIEVGAAMSRPSRQIVPCFSFRSLIFASLFLGCCIASSLAADSYPQIKKEKLGDGVERWFLVRTAEPQSFLAERFQSVYNVLLSKNTQPFGRSIAFLVGVGNYQKISPNLPSVHNDLVEMRQLLLNDAGFDEVYVASDDVVSRDLIEQYIKARIGKTASKYDRLLFYYSGHGGDNGGKTGYMLFSHAEKGQFWGPQVLAVDTLMDWSRELPFGHMLFILDSCASGITFTSKSQNDDDQNALIRTLSGDGSRTVITAATGDESAYALRGRDDFENGVFTAAMLDTFRTYVQSNSPLITIEQLFAGIQLKVAKFRVERGLKTTPREWKLQELEYPGTFVFLNVHATGAILSKEESKTLGITVSKGSSDSQTQSDDALALVGVASSEDGTLYVDGQDEGQIYRGSTVTFKYQRAGTHRLQFVPAPRSSVRPGDESKEVTVKAGDRVFAVFGAASPIDKSGKIPVGSLSVETTHGQSGDVFIDDFNVGHIEKDGRIEIAQVIAGPHKIRIEEDDRTVEYGTVVSAEETNYNVLAPPSPPSGLTAVVN
jgi:hypothetical protein